MMPSRTAFAVVCLTATLLAGCGSDSTAKPDSAVTSTLTPSPVATTPAPAATAKPATKPTAKPAAPKPGALSTAGRVCTKLEEPLRAFPGHTLSTATQGQYLQETQELQSMVNGSGPGKDCIPEDGDFGPVTRDAVLKFQKANGLLVDGKVGPQTWEQLQLILSH